MHLCKYSVFAKCGCSFSEKTKPDFDLDCYHNFFLLSGCTLIYVPLVFHFAGNLKINCHHDRFSCPLFSHFTPMFPVLSTLPIWQLLVQSQQLKHQNNVWNLFKVINKDTRTTSLDLVVFLLLVLNKYLPLFCSFHCWL